MSSNAFAPSLTPFPVDPGLFSMFYSDAGSGWSKSLGMGVAGALASNAVWRMGFLLPAVLPTGTLALRLWARANATVGEARVNAKWAMCGSGANPSVTVLNTETTRALTWGAGDAGKFKLVTVVLDAVAPLPGQMLLLDLSFEATGWSLAVPSAWMAFLEFAFGVVDSGLISGFTINLVGNFALTQGTPFTYLDRSNDDLTDTNMVVVGPRWERSGDSACFSDSTGQSQPSLTNKAVRRWTATAPGTVRVLGTVRRPASTGDGSFVRVFHRSPICDTLLAVWAPLTNANGTKAFDISQAVAIGDSIHFEVASGTVDAVGDAVIWTGTISA